MADRYWVGGTANWDGTAGTKWSATSGGAGGATVPTSADDVFFNAASGASTVTVAATANARSINCTGFTGTITGSSGINVSGSITLVPAMTWSHSGTVTIIGTGTLTTAGKVFSITTINGAGITVTLGDPLDVTGRNLTVSQGTFTTNGHNIIASSFISQTTSVRTINLGASTLTLSNGILFTIPDNLTFNAGTSQINITSLAATTLEGGGRTFNNVTVNAPSCSIGGDNTFANLTVVGPAAAGFRFLALAAGSVNTVTAFATSGTAGNRRVWFRSGTYGISARLIVNSTTTLTDADFRDVIVTGTAAPISGTRIGDLRGNGGITFSAPKTVYWNLGGTSATLSDNAWAANSGGTPSIDNFPLAQDTAVFDNSSTVPSGNIITSADVPYIGTVDMGSRTTAIRFQTAFNLDVYGNFTCGSGTVLSDNAGLTFTGRNTQTITSAGKTFSGNLTVDSYGGTVILNGDLITASRFLIVTNGTFDTDGFAVTAGRLDSNNSNVRSIFLRTSTVILDGSIPVNLFTSTNLTFDPGSSNIQCTNTGSPTLNSGGLTFHNVSFIVGTGGSVTIESINTFNNLSVTAPTATNTYGVIFNADQTINGTFTVNGASPIRRLFVRSDTLGTTRTLTVNSLSATDCDFRDITIAGVAAGSSQTRAGNCGGNSGITFPAPKTVYWNLAGTQNWSATGWATSSGGTPNINNFPLAQDTAVFDNAGAAGTVTMETIWNIGSLDSGSRTTAMTLFYRGNIHGNWTTGTGLTLTAGGSQLIFRGRGINTITSNGVVFGGSAGSVFLAVDCVTGTIQLADAFSSSTGLSVDSGTFNAVTYNFTSSLFVTNTSSVKSIIMGTGTWTITGTGAIAWQIGQTTNLTFNKDTANIVLSDNTTTARTFVGGGLSYNKLTIGGNTSTSTTTIEGNNQFTELASTKTVAHTIALGTTTQTFGAWTVTGTAGNVVTLTGTGISHAIAGAAVSGIDYLAMGSIGFASTSPGEFYAGANSTGTAGVPVYRTAKPADSIRYWVGGTGNWSDTARWSTGSGGAGGASVPRSHDDVVFNSASNATAYTATVNTVSGGIRCKSLTISGPASGNLTLAGTTAIVGIHGNVTLPATGLTRTYSGSITLSGSSGSSTITTNGVNLGNELDVNGMGCTWVMGSALWNLGNSFILRAGTFKTNGFAFSPANITSIGSASRSLILGSSLVTFNSSASAINWTGNTLNFTFDAGTSTIVDPGNKSASGGFSGGGFTYNIVSFTGLATSGAGATLAITGNNTFNELRITNRDTVGILPITFSGDQTIGTLTIANTGVDNATMRYVFRSFNVGVPRTLTINTVSNLKDVDFSDITIAGTAAPVSGTRLGDCKGNSGITFPAGVSKFWNLAGGGNWSATAWATTGGGTPNINNFPLAQDTCVFQATGLNTGSTITMNASFNVGTVDMSARTTNTMTFNISNAFTIYGNWINGTGTTIGTASTITFSGRGSQTITSAGKAMTALTIDSPGGTVTLQDSYSATSAQLALNRGTFSLNNFNLTTQTFVSGATATRGLVFGSGTYTLVSTPFTVTSPEGFTATGSNGTISMTSASAKTFTGGGINYSGITLNQGGAGTLTIAGDNRFRDITATVTSSSAATISLGTATQRVSQFTGKGESTRLLTIRGTNAANPCALVFDGTGLATNSAVDFLSLIGVRAYRLTDTWYAGNNSTNGGTLGWIFSPTPAALPGNGNFFLMFL